VRDYLKGVWRLRHFWAALVRIDLRNRYRRSMIGMGWSLLHPLAMTAVLCTVFSQLWGMDIRAYGPFLMAGLTTWNFIVVVTNHGCQSFFQNESYIRQHPAPLAIYPLRVTLGAGVHLLLGMVVVLGLSWTMGGFHNLATLPALLPALALLLLLGWSLAILMGVINVLFQDTQHLIEVLLQALFYLTPIIYPPSLLRDRHLGWMIDVNPLASFMELVRRAVLDGSPILDGCLPLWRAYAVAAGTVLVATMAAALVLSRIERRMVFYL
jgi:lipopolysaccharide transport system permease protein